MAQSIPAFVPLAVRSPYFNCWVNASSPMLTTPTFWNGLHLGWTGIVRVDGVAYEWLGGNSPAFNTTTLLGLEFTPTKTIFILQAGPSMQVNATFMTPIETDDIVKQSMPFSYLYLDAVSTDGQPHDFQAYVDITGEWVSGNRSEIMAWNTTQGSTSTFFQVNLNTPAQFQEKTDMAEDTVTHLAMRSGPNVATYVADLFQGRIGFANTSVPAGLFQDTPRAISDHFPVFAFTVDLGKVTQTSQSLVWSVGAMRNPVVSLVTPNGTMQDRAPYFLTKYPDLQSAIDAFLLDFDDARNRSTSLDQKILNDASSVSQTYAELVSLGARQAIGATDITVSRGTDGQWNSSDVMMFMKDVGTSGRVNPVEGLYASFPFFLYVNPEYAGLLLEPLLQYQNSSQYNQSYAATDLGGTYPQATGSNRAHSQGIEQSGNMLIMVSAHALVSGDGTLIDRYYDLLFTWASFLVDTIPNPGQQITPDLASTPNLSNLLIKGIIALQAMAKISYILNRRDDASSFSNSSQTLLQLWQTSSVSSDGTHVLASFGDQNQSSWTLPYNLFADKLLQTNIINDNLYLSQTTFLKNLLSSSSSPASPFGTPIDSSATTSTIADASWTLFTAAIATDSGLRDILMQPVYSHIASPQSAFAYSKVYKLDATGAFQSGRASSALGAFFAPLALNLPFKSVTVPADQSATHSRSLIGPIVGGVLGGLAIVILAVVAGLFYWRRRQRNKYPFGGQLDMAADEAVPVSVSVYRLSAEHSSTEPLNPERTSLDSHQPETSLRTTTETPMYYTAANHLTSPKAREAMGERHQASPAAVSTPSAVSSASPPTTAPASSPSAYETQGIIGAVETLRRAVEEMQAERRAEAPPSYSQ
ncbi:hypothetical protein EIP91_006856 [Steccherinum ochraceum]|uniref:DUF1793-domain-containing protein n=1 Tax=Steccherinum ochraceum TaxID=92696 RepID=A0A4R0RM32_9APHY|nr:hypothetical protein EIP91_006856 [Steccherinum ochraceum]